jgi:CubicO group peptidase (beta-lactamase class C family)
MHINDNKNMKKGLALKIVSFYFLFFLFFACQKPVEESSIPTPVDVPVSEKVGHSSFQAAVSRFEMSLAKDVAEDGVGSMSAAVVVGNDVVWSKGFGWADVENRIPANENTIYRIGSISKSVTAVLMMQMIEKGFFQLDDPVENYLSEINELAEKPENSVPLTFRHLASHTSGLIREPKLRGAASGPIHLWEEKILESIPKTHYSTLPGEKYSYSNIGYGILGFAVSRAAGDSFMDLVVENIFTPLGMDSSFFILRKEHIPRLSMGYVKRRDGSLNASSPALEHAGRGYKVPNGGVYSTVRDLSRFIAALTGSHPVKIISEETRMEILKQQTPENGARYGLGFSIQIDEEGFTTMGHGGSVAGYNATLVFNLETSIGAVILRNYSRGQTSLGKSARGLVRELARSEEMPSPSQIE